MTTLEHLERSETHDAKEAAKKEYRRLIEIAADRGGITRLDDGDRNSLLKAAQVMGLPPSHDLEADAGRIPRIASAEAQLADAKDRLTGFPPEQEIRQQIEDADESIKSTLPALLQYKREQLSLLERRRAAMDAVRGAQATLSAYRNESSHLLSI